jgi:ArsR family metal-binding transcriptional regulator
MNLVDIELFSSKCNVFATAVNARAVLDEDLAPLMPYLNATQKRCQYVPEIPHAKFIRGGRWVLVCGNTVSGIGYEDEESARRGARELADFIRDFAASCDSVEPDETPYKPPSVMEVFKTLPRRPGCSDCGFPSCMAFAAAVVREEAQPWDCPWKEREEA